MTIVLFGVTARSEVRLESDRLWRRASAIAIGQHVLSFQTAYQKTDNRFSQDGELRPLGEQYNRKVSWKQVLANGNTAEQSDLRKYMRSHGVSDGDVAAVSTYHLEQEDLTYELKWAYGLMDGWMIGFRVPLTHRTTRVSRNVEVSPEYSKRSDFQARQQRTAAARTKRTDVRELAERQLEQSGYDRVPDQETTWLWEDVSLLSKETLYEGYHWTWGLQQVARFPTAQRPATETYLQTSADEGQTDLGLSSLLDYRRSRWLAGLSFGYVYQMSDSIRMRVPRADGDLDSRIEPSIKRDLGDWFWASIDSEISLSRRTVFSVEHSFLTKQRDRYSGTSPTGVPYDVYGDGTDQQLQESRVGLGYRVGSSSSRNGVHNRWTASLDYIYPWVGKNSTDAGRALLEITNYF